MVAGDEAALRDTSSSAPEPAALKLTPPRPPIDKLAAALAKAQAALEPPKRSREVMVRTDKGSYTYTYAELADVIAAVTKAFAPHGLSFVQDAATGSSSDAAWVTVTLTLFHESGQRLDFLPFTLPVLNRSPQGFGSALTFARRYQVQTALGIAAEADDDARAAQAIADTDPRVAGTTADDTRKADAKVMRKVHALAAQKGRTHENLTDWAGRNLGIESLSELTVAGAARMIEALNTLPDVPPPSPADDTNGEAPAEQAALEAEGYGS